MENCSGIGSVIAISKKNSGDGIEEKEGAKYKLISKQINKGHIKMNIM